MKIAKGLSMKQWKTRRALLGGGLAGAAGAAGLIGVAHNASKKSEPSEKDAEKSEGKLDKYMKKKGLCK